ncbi:MAG: zinc metallopeptidase [Gammaproteobacteria bacterium]
MPLLILLIVGVAVLLGPMWWTRRTIARHSHERDDFPGTGGEFARHLLDRLELRDVGVESTERGDHYDPAGRVVRLLPQHKDGKSLAAVVIAAHEVGHAMQHASGYAPLDWRTRLASTAATIQRLGAGMMLLVPLIAVVTRSPVGSSITLLAGLATLGVGALVHLVTLPVEWDASFRRALPILESGYIGKQDLPAARQLLTAAALTYVAGALGALLNIWAWLRLIRR